MQCSGYSHSRAIPSQQTETGPSNYTYALNCNGKYIAFSMAGHVCVGQRFFAALTLSAGTCTATKKNDDWIAIFSQASTSSVSAQQYECRDHAVCARPVCTSLCIVVVVRTPCCSTATSSGRCRSCEFSSSIFSRAFHGSGFVRVIEPVPLPVRFQNLPTRPNPYRDKCSTF